MSAEAAPDWRLGELASHHPEVVLDGVKRTQSARLAAAAAALVAAGRDRATPCVALVVPGRVEVLGKHTDYAGGRSLTAATDQGFCVVGVARAEAKLLVIDCGPEGGAPLAGEFAIGERRPPAGRRWLTYPMTVARRLAADFPGAVGGADIAFSSDLPVAAGLSSSSALVTGVYLILAAFGGVHGHPRYRAAIDGPETLAGYLGAVENGLAFGDLAAEGGVGTLGGSEDHTAIVCSRRRRLGQYSYLPVRRERSLELPAGHLFAVAFSGVVAEKSGAARADYNRLSRLAAAAAVLCDEPHLAAALGAAGGVEELLETIRREASGRRGAALERRVRHFISESEELVPAAGDALAAGDVAAFGRVANRSHDLGVELLGNDTAATTFLAESARRGGAVGASAFGAGFGGSVWALVGHDGAGEFLARWSADYATAFPRQAEGSRFFLTTAAAGARRARRREATA